MVILRRNWSKLHGWQIGLEAHHPLSGINVSAYCLTQVKETYRSSVYCNGLTSDFFCCLGKTFRAFPQYGQGSWVTSIATPVLDPIAYLITAGRKRSGFLTLNI